MFQLVNYTYILYIIIVLTQSCIVNKYLNENEYFLASQKIKGNKKINSSLLKSTFQQESNFGSSTFPISVFIYQIGASAYDTTIINNNINLIEKKFNNKIEKAISKGNNKKAQRLTRQKNRQIKKKEELLENGNLMMRWGSKPIIYDSNKADLTRDKMKSLLRQNGYFDAQVNVTSKVNKKNINVIYNVIENSPYYIADNSYFITNKSIEDIVINNRSESYIKEGELYRVENIDKERIRIYDLLTNNGYYDFNLSNINFEVVIDSKLHQASIKTIITNSNIPTQKYYTKEILFTTDSELLNIKKLDNINFRSRYGFNNLLVLTKKVLIKVDSPYSAQNISQTIKNLYNLNIFKDIYITHNIIGDQISTFINAYPDKPKSINLKLQIQNDKSVFSILTDLDLNTKNLFKKLGNLDVETSLSLDDIEGMFKQKYYLSWDIKIINTIPYMYIPLIKTPKLYKSNIKTKQYLTYKIENQEHLKKSSVKANWVYIWELNKQKSYKIKPFSIIISNIKHESDNKLLNKNEKSFFLDKISLRYSVITNPYIDLYKNNTQYKVLFECAGLFHLNKIIKTKLEYYKYFNFKFKYEKSYKLNSVGSFKHKAFIGVILPYSSNKLIPYDEYYYVDGANGIRGWHKKELGPGSSNDNSIKNGGDLAIQASLELNKAISSNTAAAIFIDFGNVWLINNCTSEAAMFKINKFYKEIAISSGIGLRFKLSIILMSIDMGIKIYDPSLPVNKRFTLSNILKPKTYAFHFRLGY